MAQATGTTIKGGIMKESVWGTEISPTGGAGIEILPGSVRTVTKPPILSPSSDQPFPKASNVSSGQVTATGLLKQALRFDDIRLLAYLMGIGASYSAPVEQNSGEGDYLHELLPADEIEGLFFTHGQLKGTDVDTWQSNKAKSFNISGEATADLDIKLDLETVMRLGYWSSGILSAGDFSALTYPATAGENKVRFDQMRIRINDASGDTLDADDAVGVKQFNFGFKRVLAEDLTDSESPIHILEPLNDGQVLDITTMSLIFNYMTATNKAFQDDLFNGTVKKIDMVFTGAQIASGDNYSLTISIPAARIIDDTNTGQYEGSGLLPGGTNFVCVEPGNASTSGMTFDEMFKLSVVNTITAKAVS